MRKARGFGHNLLALLIISLATSGCQQKPATGKRVIVLGIDGMDPAFLERHWDSLPELNRLRQGAGLKRLQTTTPPQSPVAWSTFITGLKPSGHGIFDFIHRDPETLLPVSSMGQAEQGGRKLPIGPYLLPLTSGRIRNTRAGTPFWQTLSKHGIPVTIIRMPTDFPPAECEGQALSGMGTPDLLGTFGTFSFFTDDPTWKGRTIEGGKVFQVRRDNHRTVLRVPGPENSLRKDRAPTHADITVAIDPDHPVARFDAGGRRLILKQGEWSEWIPVRFPLIDGIAAADGIIRIYVKQLHPRFAVYVSPVNIDPSSPALRISEPESYSQDLAQSIGRFYTQGMPYDTSAFRHGVFSRDEYIAHSRDVSEQTLKLLERGLANFRDGFLFFHFFGVDQDSHMLWGDYETELLDTYRLVDRTIGRVRKQAPDATLIVMSDHGFARFDRSVHLNTWLMKEGFLTLDDEANAGKGELLEHVDWNRTKAYALGLNGIYINQQHRERQGIVAEGEETEAVSNSIRSRLFQFRDPKTGEPVVHSVESSHSGSGGGTNDAGPDLIVGYYPSYRSSWQTALGGVPLTVIDDNTDEWRGDHCIAAEFVPGVLLSNRRSQAVSPKIEDLTVTILEEFGLSGAGRLEGKDIYSTRSDSQICSNKRSS